MKKRPIPIVIAIMLVIGIALLARVWVQHDTSIPPLKVNFPSASLHNVQLDPALMERDIDVSMVLALYSPLLELNAESQLTSGWADAFSWDGPHTLSLHIRQDKRLSDDSILTPADVVFSLKRLAWMQQGRNSFFAEQFCWTHHLESMDAPCPGLVVEGDRVRITTQDRIALLPQILTTAETVIIPQRSVSADGKSIVDLAINSGPYRLDGNTASSTRLLANRHHYHYHPRMPQQIEFVCEEVSKSDHIVQAFHDHLIDHVVTFSTFNGFEFKKITERLQGAIHIHQTLPMGVATLVFTPHGRAHLTIEDRQYLVKSLQDIAERCLIDLGQQAIRQPTRVMIPGSAGGALNTEEEKRYMNLQQTLPSRILALPVRIGLPNYVNNFLGPCLKGYEVVANAEHAEDLDLVFNGYDISTYEELASIRSMIGESLLDVSPETPTAWQQAYASEIDNELRLNKLKKAHFRALWEDPSVIPLWHYRTNAFVRRPWTMKFSTLSITNPFHLMRYE